MVCFRANENRTIVLFISVVSRVASERKYPGNRSAAQRNSVQKWYVFVLIHLFPVSKEIGKQVVSTEGPTCIHIDVHHILFFNFYEHTSY